MRNLMLSLMLLMFVGCAMQQKTEARLNYDETGKPVFTLLSTKSYQDLTISAKKETDGTTTFKYSAAVVDANTVAVESLKLNKELVGTLREVITVGAGVVVPGL